MAKKNVTKESGQRDELVELLANELNKANKDGGKIAYFLDEQENPAEISDWISTGSSILDLAISNRPHGGLPVGKMIEFNGLEGTGKSLVSAHVVADTQRKGGVAVVIDTENAAAPSDGDDEAPFDVPSKAVPAPSSPTAAKAKGKDSVEQAFDDLFNS